ncbi:MAG TPA: ACP S-malonyltransferase [Thermoleophilaceae bacterium]
MIGFVFPGQGSQKVGMGSALREGEPALYERYLDMADEASGLPVRRFVEEGPIEDLTRTDVAQPALFAVSLALVEVARGLGLRPGVVAGHSLGEWTAVVTAGSLGLEDGMRLVALRGRLMAEAQAERPGSMAALVGLPGEAVEELCGAASERGTVVPANFNSPSQIVVSGETAAVERVVELVGERGEGRAIPLRVGAAFHSPLMGNVEGRLAEALGEAELRDAEVPIAANAPGAPVRRADEVRNALVTQIVSPVRWVDCVRAIAGAGAERLVELGPGRVLAGLVRQIDPELDVVSADSAEKLRALPGATG